MEDGFIEEYLIFEWVGDVVIFLCVDDVSRLEDGDGEVGVEVGVVVVFCIIIVRGLVSWGFVILIFIFWWFFVVCLMFLVFLVVCSRICRKEFYWINFILINICR